jgi:pimeloyl-ACP methyl ester carboxylesterase
LLRDAIPGAKVALVPGAGHAAHLERPHTVAAMLEAHLTTGAPASRAEPTTPPSPPCA